MKRKIKVILFTGKKGQTYFRILGGNNKTVAQSEGYLSIKNAMKTIKLLQGGNDWIIKDETTKKYWKTNTKGNLYLSIQTMIF